MALNTIQNFENLRFNPFILFDSFDPDGIFFNSVPKEQTKYFCVDNRTAELNSSEKDAFSILHLNIRSLNNNFENLKPFLAELGFRFQIICLTESWCFADADN